jgi:RNA polymerase sigma factor (sigma-70 family)
MRSDTASVGKHEDEHLRRFVAARGRGDAREMRHWWNELVVDFYDRMDGLVAVAHRGRLDAEEHDLAVAMSLTRFSKNLMVTFDGVSIGQLVNACKTLTRGICMDVQRSSMRTHRHEGPSLDASWDADSTDGYTPAWEADEAALRYENDVRAAEVRDFLDWALPQVKEERRRVLELTFHGAELPEIADELDITRDNAYQRRSRGMKDLKKLKELYDA